MAGVNKTNTPQIQPDYAKAGGGKKKPEQTTTKQPSNKAAKQQPQAAKKPSSQAANQPANQPTSQPASQPANQPTSQPANQPTNPINQQQNKAPNIGFQRNHQKQRTKTSVSVAIRQGTVGLAAVGAEGCRDLRLVGQAPLGPAHRDAQLPAAEEVQELLQMSTGRCLWVA